MPAPGRLLGDGGRIPQGTGCVGRGMGSNSDAAARPGRPEGVLEGPEVQGWLQALNFRRLPEFIERDRLGISD